MVLLSRWMGPLAVILVALLAACAPAVAGGDEGNGEAPDDPDAAIEGYQDWTRLRPERESITAHLYTLCRMPTGFESDLMESEHGGLRYVLDYVNDAGAQAIGETDGRTFPVGTVIVKEKYPSADAGEPEALGVMIKRAPGFDPAGGDWEYLYWTPGSGWTRGADASASCQACHAQISDLDYVFHGAPPERLAPIFAGE